MLGARLVLLLLCVVAAAPTFAGERLTPRPVAEVTKQLEVWAKESKHATLIQFGVSAGRTPLIALRIGAPGPLALDVRPAIFVGANIAGDRPLGTEAALDLARELLEGPPATRAQREALLKRVSFYVVPILNPDAHDAALAPGRWGRRGNAQSRDADRDGVTNEDGPSDLNGDGRVTQLRILDPAGEWVSDPRLPDLLVKAEASLGERGRYRLETEGRDEDGDGRFNEDPADGVHVDRNFAHAFPYPASEAGPWASSAPESKAVMDFLLARRQVALAIVFGRANTLLKLPAAGPRPKGRAASKFLPEDRATLERIAGHYTRHLAAKELPTKRPAETIAGGSFAAWLYYQYGALTLELDVWGAPSEAPGKAPAALKLADLAKLSAGDLKTKAAGHDALVAKVGAPLTLGAASLANDLASGALTPRQLAARLAPYAAFAKTPAGKERARQRGTIAWWASQGVAPISSFAAVALKGHKAEVGGLHPLADQFPPEKLGRSALAAHTSFVLDLAGRLGRVEIRSLKLTSLGAGVQRLDVVIGNAGELPTHTALATLARARLPLRIELDFDPGTLITGRAWAAHERLSGSAEVFKHTWLVQGAEGVGVRVRATSEQAGRAVRSSVTRKIR
ncbi:MAG: hypothetical protein JKY65_26185 [Planctomycetes bacterium]|nr:hypothetical protein [Planctomycetota bacterium]